MPFLDSVLPTPPGPTLLWGPGSIPNFWLTCVGSSSRLIQTGFGKYANMGFSFPRETLGLRLSDLSCHHETWLHLDFVDRNWSHPRLDESDQRAELKERPTPHQYGSRKRNINDLMSDHALSL